MLCVACWRTSAATRLSLCALITCPRVQFSQFWYCVIRPPATVPHGEQGMREQTHVLGTKHGCWQRSALYHGVGVCVWGCISVSGMNGQLTNCFDGLYHSNRHSLRVLYWAHCLWERQTVRGRCLMLIEGDDEDNAERTQGKSYRLTSNVKHVCANRAI